MKLYKSLLACMALAVSSVALTSCDEELAVSPLNIPTVPEGIVANTTIADFKAKYWSTETNYCTEVGKTDEGEDVILCGHIIANDEGGNIYQTLVFEDATDALTVSVKTTNSAGVLPHLYTKYKVGEELYINVTGLYAGKYAGLFQLGAAGEYNGTPQTDRMDSQTFLDHTYLNGLPDLSKVTAIEMTIPELLAATSVEDQQRLQSRRVSIKDVSWIGGGTENWGIVGTSSTAESRYLIDAQGNKITVRNSNLSDFVDQPLPAGHGNITAILSQFNGTWQLLFQLPSDCVDFGGESYAPQVVGEGTAEDPYSVSSVLAGATGEAWVTGYIVGWIDGQVLSTGAKFNGSASVKTNLLLAASPDVTEVAQCIPVQLPTGTIRDALNLQDNPGNYQKQVTLKGSLETYFGSAGLKSVSLYAWGDKGNESGTTPDVPTPPAGDGDGSVEKPYDVAQILGGATGTSVWSTGYIVGAINDKSISDAAFVGPFALKTNILIAATAGETDITKCVPVQLPAGTVRDAVNLVDNTDNLGKKIMLKGNLEKYFGAAGIKSVTEYSWSDGTENPPVAGATFRKVTTITSGKQYLIVASGKCALLDSRDYGYLNVTDVTDNNGEITGADAANAYTFTAVSGGYNITMSNGKYVYQKGTYNSFNFDTTAVDGSIWSVVAQSDGTFKITNASTNKFVQYDSNYNSYGCYADSKGEMPALYEKVD